MYMAKKFVDGNKEFSFSELLEGNKMMISYFNQSGIMTSAASTYLEEKHLKELRTWITQQLNKIKK